MAPSEFFVVLQKGITGGFAPPTPSAVYTLTASSDNPAVVLVQAQTREEGTPSLSDPLAPKEVAVSAAEGKINELESILKQLPVEVPTGSQDIYGLDTSIFFGSGDLEWRNGGPQGCGGGVSEVQATDEQKEKFKRAVEIVESLV
ncbi:hypothetical protein DACRYDRAFT_19518 [Dacryopinax primogenitus]|uniref:Uncharacterized protein n=1 Tax=Dacryopinax primogenitus (strain DJM 731) TaxID=1858805 RepID=M5GGY4_DACPD|nr:uncharacterized protein DACRYDRAFT_19518 [Dacryopinax primogenitus]EJU06293.1 hypothetical protein DACRYDRAFT_19518 [Dacryopinax primogenitus]